MFWENPDLFVTILFVLPVAVTVLLVIVSLGIRFIRFVTMSPMDREIERMAKQLNKAQREMDRLRKQIYD